MAKLIYVEVATYKYHKGKEGRTNVKIVRFTIPFLSKPMLYLPGVRALAEMFVSDVGT